jgi:predicted nucleic acid-binding protein
VILYLETSALLKLHLDEPGSAEVVAACGSAKAVTTHVIAYVEVCAALAKAVKLERIESSTLEEHKATFDSNWRTMSIVSMTETIMRRAGDLALRFGLRGYDSVHLAAAESVWHALGPESEFRFAVFDRMLITCAKELAIPLLDAEPAVGDQR